MKTRYDPRLIRGRLRAIQLNWMCRVVHRRHRRKPLGVVPTPSRFGDPDGRYAVLYAAQSVQCGFWEAIARNRFTHRQRRELPLSDVESRIVVSLRSAVPLDLVDLRGDGAVRIGAPTAVAHDANHSAGRALSAATYAKVPEADGFLYKSRFTDHECAAVFDRAIEKLECLDVTPLIQYADFLSVLREYRIVLTTSPK